MPIDVNMSRCPQNHKCPAVKLCKHGALSQDGFGAPVVDREKCTDCGKCSSFCPMRALQLEGGPSKKDSAGAETGAESRAAM